jgi:hypothetical protein
MPRGKCIAGPKKSVYSRRRSKFDTDINHDENNIRNYCCGRGRTAIAQAALSLSRDIKTGIVNLETRCKPEAENLFQRRDAVSARSR